MDGAILVAQGLVKRYPMGVTALDGVSLTIRRGEFVGIMGRSGSGKSTLMHMLGCLDRPDAGSIWLEGVEVTRLPDRRLPALRRAKLGFVFQSGNLLPSLTALENVLLPLRYSRVPRAEALARACALLERVGLGDRLHHLPSQLSGGEQQRVAIARALVNDPELLLADEPTGELDTRTGEKVLELLSKLHRERGMTIVMTSHDPRIAEQAPAVVRLEDGRVVAHAT